MFEIRYVAEADKAFWFSLEEEMSESEFLLKVRDKRGYVIGDGGNPVGIMRYNLCWNITPFLTLIYFKEFHRSRGFGSLALQFWEEEMKQQGYKMVMTSTTVTEQAQHFYRKRGYIERGGLFLDGTPMAQPQEMFLIKVL